MPPPPEAGNLIDATKGFAKGVGQGVVSLAEGVKDLAVAGYQLKDKEARDALADKASAMASQASDYASSVKSDPKRVLDDARNLAGKASEAFDKAHAASNAAGVPEAEFYATFVGRGIFEAALFLVGAGEAKAAVQGARAAEEVAEATRALKAADVVAEAAEAAPKAAAVAKCPLAAEAEAKGAKFFYNAKAREWRSVETGEVVHPRNIPWPDKAGFVERSPPRPVEVGTVLDRYGEPTGKYLGEPGATISERGLPVGNDAAPYHRYKVIKPFEAEVGAAAPVPDFGAGGGANQYLTNKSVQQLIDEGFLEEIQ